MKDTIQYGKTFIAGGCFSLNKTYQVVSGSVDIIQELECNHKEADTGVFAHAAWSKKKSLQFVAADTDLFAILLLNHSKFSQKTMLIKHSDDNEILNVCSFIKTMEEDSDQELAVLNRRQFVTIPFLFGIIHPLIGSDILCSPRSFGPFSVMKACIDFCLYLSDSDVGLQHLKDRVDNCK